MEEWKKIDDTNYEVSQDGNIRHVKNKRNLSKFLNNGYLQVSISFNGKPKKIAIHRAVASAFLPKNEGRSTVNHKNGDKNDNRAENLEWCSQLENVHHSIESGLSKVRICPITQFSLEGKEVARYTSIQEIETKLGYDRSLIIRVCKGKGKTAYGSKWQYSNDPCPVKDEPDGKTYQHYDRYIVTKDGKIFSKTTRKFLKPIINANGHAYVTFSKKGEKKRNLYIHTLVAKLFLSNPNNFTIVFHKNGKKDDNSVENLQWVKYQNKAGELSDTKQ